jgi:hypothetical protein
MGADTREIRVTAQECPALALHHIAHVGVAHAVAPYEMVRMDLSGTYLLSCSAGAGQIFLDAAGLPRRQRSAVGVQLGPVPAAA